MQEKTTVLNHNHRTICPGSAGNFVLKKRGTWSRVIFPVILFIHVNFLGLYSLIKKSSWPCWRLIIIRYARCRNHGYQPIPGFSVLKVMALSSLHVCFFPPFARYHLNKPATSNRHFGQCCEERYFRAVDKFDNIIVLCWFSLPEGVHFFFVFIITEQFWPTLWTDCG